MAVKDKDISKQEKAVLDENKDILIKEKKPAKKSIILKASPSKPKSEPKAETKAETKKVSASKTKAKSEDNKVEKKEPVKKTGGFKEIEREVTKMCNLGEMIASENMQQGLKQGIEQGQKKKNIEHVRNLMNEFQCSKQRAMDILKLTNSERKEIEKYFHS